MRLDDAPPQESDARGPFVRALLKAVWSAYMLAGWLAPGRVPFLQLMVFFAGVLCVHGRAVPRPGSREGAAGAGAE